MFPTPLMHRYRRAVAEERACSPAPECVPATGLVFHRKDGQWPCLQKVAQRMRPVLTKADLIRENLNPFP
jgi:hypothetical protein